MRQSGTLEKAGLGYTLTRLVHREDPVRLSVNSPEGCFVLFIDERGVRLDRIEGGFATGVEDYLLHESQITELDLLRVLTEQVLSGRTTDEVLLERGKVSADGLDRLKVRQIEDELLRMLSINKGEYEIEPAESDAQDRDEAIPALFFDIEKMAAAALDRMSKFDGISRDTHSEAEFFLADESRLGPVLETLESGVDKNVLSSLTGAKPLRDIAQDLDLAPFKVAAIVGKYMQEGLVRPLSVAELRQGARDALQQEDPVASLAYLRRAFDRERYDAEIVEELGNLFEYAGENALAAGFYTLLGALLIRGGKVDGGEDSWQKAADLDPGNLEVQEILFRRRLESGSRQKAVESGLALVTLALENGAAVQARKILETLLEEEGQSFAVRRKRLDLLVHEQDLEGARSELAALEALAAESPDPAVEQALPSAYMTLLRVDPENAEIRQKLNVTLKAARAKTQGGRMVRILAVAVLVVAGAGAGYYFGFHRPAAQRGDRGDPSGPALPQNRPDPNAKRRLSMLEEARGHAVAGDFEKAVTTFAAIMEITPRNHHLHGDIEKEQVAAQKSLRDKKAREFTELLQGLSKRAAEAVDRGKRGEEPDVDREKETVNKVLAEMDEVSAICPEECASDLAMEQQAARDGLKALDLRKAQVLFLRGELEWDKRKPDPELAKTYFRQAFEIENAGEVGTRARERVRAVERYMEESAQAHAKGTSALEKARTADGSIRDTVIQMALLHLRKVVEEYPKSPLASSVRYPIWVETEPPGARVALRGTDKEFVSPTLVTYDPETPGVLEVTKAGFLLKKMAVPKHQTSAKVVLDRGVLWAFQAGDKVDRGPVTDGTRFFFGCRDGGLYAYTAPGREDPKPCWPPFRVKDIGGVKTEPRIWEGRVIFSSANLGEIWALDAVTGKVVWGPVRARRTVTHTPAVAAGYPFAVVGDIGGTLYALKGDTGEVAWEASVTGTNEGIRSQPALFPSLGCLFVGTTQGALLKVSLEDRSVVWRAASGVGGVMRALEAGPTVAGLTASRLLVFDAAATEAPEKPLWSTGGFFELAMPVFRDGALHLTDKGGNYEVFQTQDGGKTLSKSFGASGKDPVSPLLLDDRVVLTSSSTLTLYRVEKGTMRALWKVQLPGEANEPLIVHDGKIVLTTTEGVCCAVLLD